MYRPPWRRKERICVVTAYDAPYAPVARLTTPRMKALCDAHGYELRVAAIESGPKHSWIKVEPIRRALDDAFDWLLWLDADALVIRTDEDIRAECRGGSDIRMAWHQPHAQSRSEDPAHFNAGVMLIRCCDWSRDFFARVWDKGQIAHHWADQATILHLLGYDDVLKLGARRSDGEDHKHAGMLKIAWNAIPGVATCEDPIVHHYAGVRLDTRLRILEMDSKTLPYRENKRRSERARYAELFDRLRYHAKGLDDIEDAIASLDESANRQLEKDRRSSGSTG